MLGPGDSLPAARVWAEGEQTTLTRVAASTGTPLALLCFYPFDWSGG
ncbi:MAG: hypothetical protein ACKVUT_06925 [Gaiella sp.]